MFVYFRLPRAEVLVLCTWLVGCELIVLKLYVTIVDIPRNERIKVSMIGVL
jgi:hypothetical protein